MQKRFKNILTTFLKTTIGLGIFIAIGWTIGSKAGKQLQLKYLGNSYVQTNATVKAIGAVYHSGAATYGSGNAPSGYFLEEEVTYQVDGKDYSEGYDEDLYLAVEKRKEAKAYVKTLPQPGETITIYYDPKKPEHFIIHPEDENHLWFDFLILIPLSLLATSFTLSGIVSGSETIKET